MKITSATRTVIIVLFAILFIRSYTDIAHLIFSLRYGTKAIHAFRVAEHKLLHLTIHFEHP